MGRGGHTALHGYTVLSERKSNWKGGLECFRLEGDKQTATPIDTGEDGKKKGGFGKSGVKETKSRW